MSTEVATDAADIAEVMANAGQLGIQNDYLVEFTRTMIDLGNSTDIAADEAATAIAQFANITKMSQADFGRFWFCTGRSGQQLRHHRIRHHEHG